MRAAVQAARESTEASIAETEAQMRQSKAEADAASKEMARIERAIAIVAAQLRVGGFLHTSRSSVAIAVIKT